MEEGLDQQPEEAQSPVPSPAPEPKPVTRKERRKRKRLIILASAAALLLALGGLYWFLVVKGGDKTPAQSVASGQDKQTKTPAPTPSDPTPVAYKSTKLNIEITHRKDWSLKESSSGQITITSPTISYVASDGQSTTGVFTVKIRRGVTDAMQANIDKAVAPRDSEVIAYAAPTEQQRQYTNLSYAGQKDFFSFFIVTGNTALKAGNSFAYSLPLDGDFYLVVGGYGADAGDSLSFESVPKDSMSSMAFDEALNIVKSLKIY